MSFTLEIEPGRKTTHSSLAWCLVPPWATASGAPHI